MIARGVDSTFAARAVRRCRRRVLQRVRIDQRPGASNFQRRRRTDASRRYLGKAELSLRTGHYHLVVAVNAEFRQQHEIQAIYQASFLGIVEKLFEIEPKTLLLGLQNKRNKGNTFVELPGS